MKKAILIVCAAFALAGCNRQQGGTSDQYGTERGTSSTMTNAPSSSVTTSTNTFGTSDTNSQGGATSQGGSGTGTSSSEIKTNSSSNP